MWNSKDFLNQKEGVIKYFKKKGVDSSTVSEYCSMVGLPLIVVYEFIGDEMSEYKDFCNDKIHGIKDFYGILKGDKDD